MVEWFYGTDFCHIFTGSVCFRGDGIGEGEGLTLYVGRNRV
jgi:hypothetical protein